MQRLLHNNLQSGKLDKTHCKHWMGCLQNSRVEVYGSAGFGAPCTLQAGCGFWFPSLWRDEVGLKWLLFFSALPFCFLSFSYTHNIFLINIFLIIWFTLCPQNLFSPLLHAGLPIPKSTKPNCHFTLEPLINSSCFLKISTGNYNNNCNIKTSVGHYFSHLYIYTN